MSRKRTTTKNGDTMIYGSDPNIIGDSPSNPMYVKSPPLPGPDNLYVNISVRGGNTGIQNQPHKTFTFSERFFEPILKNIQNYYLSIVSVAFSATEVPLTIINNIQTGSTQTNPNLTNWSFCFSFGGNDYQEFVEYIPFNNMIVPNAPSENPPNYKQTVSNYYFIEHYNVLTTMFNQTLQNIYVTMFTANAAALTLLGLTIADYPFFIYDSTTEKFKLVYNKLFVGNGIDLYFSDTFSVFFPGFYDYFYGTDLPLGKDYRFIFQNAPNNSYDATNNENVQMYGGSTTNLNTINQIIITSNTLRTSFELITNDDGPGNNYSYGNVIFSLLPNLETPKASKSRLVYVTNGQYRLIDIISEGHINQVDFNVYYSDNNGNVYPISVPEGMTANAKIIFMKKTLKNYVY